MASTEEEVLERLSAPAQTVAQVLDERWNEISRGCPDRRGYTCRITGRKCRWEKCPKLAKNVESEV